jgi:membrane fusion protein (multidrug efflux system)
MSTPSTSTAQQLDAQILPIREDAAPAPRIEAVPLPPAPAKPRNRAKVIFPALIGLAVVGGGLRYALTHGRETTDDAQIEGRVVNVAARVTGQVTKVLVLDNQAVKTGELLVELDHAELDARVEVAQADLASAKAALASAESQLALTERNTEATIKQARGGITQASSTIASSKAAVEQAKADISAAEARLRLADVDLKRVMTLRTDNAVPQAELDAKQSAFDQAKASLEQARARYNATKAGINGASGGLTFAEGRLAAADTAPQQVATARAAVDLAAARVKQTEAALHVAELNASYTYVKASADGVVSRRTVEVGQLVSPERALMAVVPQKDVWVVANFKEDQIGEMAPNQPATVTVDSSNRTFHGHVDSIAGASGARFSLLPPDNASGNYVKVVQRVPVLIRLDDMGDAPLRPGLSADVTVDTRSK